MKIVILGLSITSSWGNGHATTYRCLARGLAERGHDVLFLERDVPWYAQNRDLARAPYARIEIYSRLKQLKQRFASQVRDADVVIVGSYVPQGIEAGDWVVRTAHGVTAFYDIDTPVTLAQLHSGTSEYLTAALIPRYELYLSFTGGPTLERIEEEYGSPRARPLYCSVDPESYFPEPALTRWDLAYMGTYSKDRQPALGELLLEPARMMPRRRFAIVGPQYPRDIGWPRNVRRSDHLAPAEHRAFYNSQTFTLNVTRAQMIRSGYSPSVRIFEAAACGTPIISDAWAGIETVLRPGTEILVARGAQDIVEYLQEISEPERNAIANRARAAVLARHTAAHRAAELEAYVREVNRRPQQEGEAVAV
ncbi:MAG: CgeB family protein [Gemmatimonadota bacterium]